MKKDLFVVTNRKEPGNKENNHIYTYREGKLDIKKELCKPFKEDEHEWRVQSMGWKNDEPWAMVLCYVQARPIQERLDEVFGVLGWQTEYKEFKDGLVCRLSVQHQNPKDDDMLVGYKEDGAPSTDVEPFKGGLSKAFVRVAASGYGIGRYLYNLDVTWAHCSAIKENGWNKAYDKKTSKSYWWQTPQLPDWALSGESPPSRIKPKSKTEEKKSIDSIIKEIVNDIMVMVEHDTDKAKLMLEKYTGFKGKDNNVVAGTQNTSDLYNYSEKRIKVIHGIVKKAREEYLENK